MPETPPSTILGDVKDILAIDKDYTVFDSQLKLHINAAMSTLNQLMIGPENGFYLVTGNESWSDYIEDVDNIENVKTLIAMKVRLIFDPPQTSYAITAIENLVKELEWRLNVKMEGVRNVH